MIVMKPSLTIFPCVLGSAFLYIRICPGLSFATKRIGPPCCTLFTLFTCYSLLFILSQNYLYHLQFQCLHRKPYWKPLIISFCSSLGSTLLLIERTTIDPLYLWVIKDRGGLWWRGAPHTAKRSTDQLVYPWGALSPVYKGVEEGEGRPPRARPKGDSYSYYE